MNNKIVVFATGALVGGGVGYLVGDALKYQYLLRMPMDDILEEKSDETDRDPEDEYTVDWSPNVTVQEIGRVDYEKVERKHIVGETDFGVLSEVVKPYLSMATDDDLPKEQKTIEIIDLAAYVGTWWNKDGYISKPVTYHSNDGKFADVLGLEITDPEKMFGPNAHLHFGEGSEDPDVVYIVNHELRKAFDITRVDEPFGEFDDDNVESKEEKITSYKQQVKRIKGNE